jgi:hypothetical protein
MKNTRKRFEIENALCIVDYENMLIDVIGESYGKLCNDLMERVAITINVADDKTKNSRKR